MIFQRLNLTFCLRSLTFNCFTSVKTRYYSKLKNFEPEYDVEYYLNPKFYEEIKHNIKKRKGVGNIDRVLEITKTLNALKQNEMVNVSQIDQLQCCLNEELRKMPNKTHPAVLSNNRDEPITVKVVGQPRKFKYKPKGFLNLAEKRKHLDNDLVRTENLTFTNGPRSYVLKNDLAELEQAIINYTVGKLKTEGFIGISVPDTLDACVIESCGMETQGKRTQVFSLDCPTYDGSLCLSGTAEMALAALFSNKLYNLSDLPKNVYAISRCYRAEVSNLQEEKGLFRVHEFTKIEMFGLTANELGDESENLLNRFCDIQQNLFTDFGLHFKVLDMPVFELGAPAYRKYDIETWFPPKRIYGEISSASNCTDYQSRRLGIRYVNHKGVNKYCHTINATACAIPRIIMALIENFQNKDGTILLPDNIVPHMNGKSQLGGDEKRLKMYFQKLK